MDEFELLFKELNIIVKDLPANYTPDEFGKELITANQLETEIVYSVSTEIYQNI